MRSPASNTKKWWVISFTIWCKRFVIITLTVNVCLLRIQKDRNFTLKNNEEGNGFWKALKLTNCVTDKYPQYYFEFFSFTRKKKWKKITFFLLFKMEKQYCYQFVIKIKTLVCDFIHRKYKGYLTKRVSQENSLPTQIGQY